MHESLLFMMYFIIYTNKKIWPVTSLQKKILEFVSTIESGVISEIDADPFDKKSKILSFLKKDIYFMGTATMGKELNDDDTNETKQYIVSKLKSRHKEHDALNSAKEKMLKFKKSFRFIFSDNISKIRDDYENLVICMTAFFKDEYDAIVIQYVQKTRTKEEFILW